MSTPDERPSFPYLSTATEDIKQLLFNRVTEITEDWTDFNTTDIGVALVELMTLLHEMSAYRRDIIASELLLPRARQRENVKAILNLINYKMHTYIAAKVPARFDLTGWTPNKDWEIPRFTQFSVKGQITGQSVITSESDVMLTNLQEIKIKKGTALADAVLVQAEVVKLVFNYDDIDDDGRIWINLDEIAEGGISIRVKPNVTSSIYSKYWTEVDDVMLVPDAGTYFAHEIDKDGLNYVTLHPMFKLHINKEAEIELVYAKTYGDKVSVGSGKAARSVNPIYDYDNVDRAGNVLITTTDHAYGGASPETIEEAKVRGPRNAKVMDTAVTLEDYEILVEEMPEVARCRALDWNYPESGINEAYIVNLYVIPKEGYNLTQSMKQDVWNYLAPKRLGSLKLNVMDPQYLDVSTIVKVKVRADSLNKDRVIDSVRAKMVQVFAADRKSDGNFNIDFGTTLYMSKIISELQTSDPDILSVDLEGIDGDIVSNGTQFIRLGAYDVELVEV